MSNAPGSTSKLVAIVVVVIVVAAAAFVVMVIDNPGYFLPNGTDTDPILAIDEPIQINGDEEMIAYASNHSLAGSGSSLDPYVIENLSIVTDRFCIDIRNIESAFVIRNCKMKATSDYAGIGIYLANCPSVTVEGCRTEGGISGIELFQCDDAEISGCTSRYTIFGINSSLSERMRIHDNVISNTTMGITAICSNETHIESNFVYDCLYGVVSQFSFNCSAIFNNVTDSTIGIKLELRCQYWILHSNILARNSEYNALDDGAFNIWDNGTDFGNYWDDFLGVGTYSIPGAAGSIDRYPQGL